MPRVLHVPGPFNYHDVVVRWYIASVPRVLHVRLDADSEAALAVLRADGMTDSQVVRLSLIEAGARRRPRASLREEAERLAGDPAERAEIAALSADLDGLTQERPPTTPATVPISPA